MKTDVFSVTGMTCSACSSHVEKAVRSLTGVQTVGVNLMTGRMSVTYDEAAVSPDAICAAVIAEGYGVGRAEGTDAKKQEDTQERAVRAMRRRLTVSLVFLVPLFYLGMGSMMHLPMPDALRGSLTLTAGLELALLLPILAANRAYFTVGYARLLRGAPNMDTLVCLGASAGIAYSLLTLLHPSDGSTMPELYFESAGMILSLVTVGKYLELRSRSKTTGALRALAALAPDSAVVLRGGKEQTVPLAEVAVGDRIIVRQGGRIPADGTVLFGEAAVDESAITGESIPAEKHTGDTVTAATISRSGYLEIEAKRVGEDTTLAQIVRLMEEASTSKAPIARLADRVSGVFVPSVIAIALLSALSWYVFGHEDVSFCLSIGIAVLVISCPCALGLATPVAVMVGTGKAAEQGILIKSAEGLETLHQVGCVVLDKTGTVTESQPTLADILPLGALGEAEALTLAASVEALSEHPLARAVTDAAKKRGIALRTDITDYSFAAGGGIEARIGGQRVLLGNRRLLTQRGVDTAEIERDAARMADGGKTPLFLALDGRLLALFALSAPIKPESRSAVDALRRRGISVVLLTGDNRHTAEAVAAELGIERVLSEVLPADKESCIAGLQREGLCVAMVGDGINDAPALARADVGIAIGAGTDIAIESADVVLMRSELTDVVSAIELSRSVIRNIRENLFWAFFYNSIGIPVAAGVFYPLFAFRLNPILAAAAMSLSSVCVVSNALRLRAWRSPFTQTTVPEEGGKDKSMTNRTMRIEGMMCTHCSGRVEQVLNAIPGVSATVDLAAKTASVSAQPQVSDDTLRKAVEDAGYQVTSVE